MQCRECNASIASDVSFCPTCGARQTIPAASVSVVRKPDPAPAAPVAIVKSTKAALPQAGDTFADRYRVEKYLGLGALCNTYLCRDASAGNQEVVLKVMHARKAAEPGMADSFLFLAESVAKYDHKGIAKVLSHGKHDGAPYYTMEWVGGVPLRLWLMERLNFENRVLPGLGLISSLLETFEVIHERGCYGCVKPENVFITLNGPVITDFGVVGFLSPQEFEFNSYARRYLPYMAPELKQDWSNLLPHSDYYSIGAILYEILVGRAPGAQLRLPSELSRLFSIEADEIILKSMAGRPLDRFATVEAFKNAVQSLQASLLHSRPPETPALAAAAELIPEPETHTALEITSDMQTVHNPEVAFTSPELLFKREDPAPAPRQATAAAANTWALERDAPVEKADAESGSAEAGSRTAFPPGPAPEEGEKTLSAFARLGDKIVEEAHAQRRFAHAGPAMAGLPDGAVSPNAAPGAAWDGSEGEPSPADIALAEEEVAAPVPAWLWAAIALLGSGMLVLSAYFGLLHHK